MVPPGRWFTRKPLLALKFLSGYVHRSTLPQSRIRSTAPSGREPGNVPHNANHPPAGCFVSGRVIFWGSVWGCMPFNRVLAKPWGCGRFSSPLRSSEWLTAPTHRGTLPQSRIRSTAPSEREPGNAPQCQSPVRWMFYQRAGDFWGLCVGVHAIQPGACETVGVRAIFIAPTKLKKFWLLPLIERHSLSQLR